MEAEGCTTLKVRLSDKKSLREQGELDTYEVIMRMSPNSQLEDRLRQQRLATH